MMGKRPKRSIENEIEFPQQPQPQRKEKLIQLVAGRIRNKALKREERNKKQGHKIYLQIGQEILIKNHKLSNSVDSEIKKLFNIYEGPYRINKIISETTIAIWNEETNKEELINKDEIRSYFREA